MKTNKIKTKNDMVLQSFAFKLALAAIILPLIVGILLSSWYAGVLTAVSVLTCATIYYINDLGQDLEAQSRQKVESHNQSNKRRTTVLSESNVFDKKPSKGVAKNRPFK